MNELLTKGHSGRTDWRTGLLARMRVRVSADPKRITGVAASCCAVALLFALSERFSPDFLEHDFLKHAAPADEPRILIQAAASRPLDVSDLLAREDVSAPGGVQVSKGQHASPESSRATLSTAHERDVDVASMSGSSDSVSQSPDRADDSLEIASIRTEVNDLERRLSLAEMKLTALAAELVALRSHGSKDVVASADNNAPLARASSPDVPVRGGPDNARGLGGPSAPPTAGVKRSAHSSEYLAQAAEKYRTKFAIDHGDFRVQRGGQIATASLSFNTGGGVPDYRLFREMGGRAVVLDVFDTISIRNAVSPKGPLSKVSVGHHAGFRRFVYQSASVLAPSIEREAGKLIVTLASDPGEAVAFSPVGLDEHPLLVSARPKNDGSKYAGDLKADPGHRLFDPSIQAAEIRKRQGMVAAASRSSMSAANAQLARLQQANPRFARDLSPEARSLIMANVSRMNFDVSAEDLEKAGRWAVRAVTSDAGVVYNRVTERIVPVQPGSEIPGAGTVLAMVPQAQMILTDLTLLERQR